MSFQAFAQLDIEDVGPGSIEDLLRKEVENPEYQKKPFLGFGVGKFSYFGDVRNEDIDPLNGNIGFHVNLTTFFDPDRRYKGNFYFMLGSLTGNERSYDKPERNMNFEATINIYGINFNYDFRHAIKGYSKLHPFVSIGAEMMTFTSKTDSFALVEGVNTKYNYWKDGTIRNIDESSLLRYDPNFELRQVKRDYSYETPLKETDWGLGDYNNYTFAIPLEVGLDYQVSDRVMLRFGVSYHFNFTDNIDHVSSKNTSGVIGDKRNDDFMFTYLALHLDFFSQKRMLEMEKFFADVELDMTLIGDEDDDGIFDGWDDCLGTPFGVEVDTVGCPLDDDMDGVPNYQDNEPHSTYGAMVDANGVEISDDQLAKQLDFSSAVARKDIGLYLRTPESYANYKKTSYKEIPQQFVKVDDDNDGYISYDEMMDAIDKFFDFDSELKSEDLQKLNEFFFSQ
ncbi:MAG: DUF6089 family protein [Bacteroidales bacterium]|nr:DUF6089 family protein [Bacteroidales bacterium]